jgi:hypothetical protein
MAHRLPNSGFAHTTRFPCAELRHEVQNHPSRWSLLAPQSASLYVYLRSRQSFYSMNVSSCSSNRCVRPDRAAAWRRTSLRREPGPHAYTAPKLRLEVASLSMYFLPLPQQRVTRFEEAAGKRRAAGAWIRRIVVCVVWVKQLRHTCSAVHYRSMFLSTPPAKVTNARDSVLATVAHTGRAGRLRRSVQTPSPATESVAFDIPRPCGRPVRPICARSMCTDDNHRACHTVRTRFRGWWTIRGRALDDRDGVAGLTRAGAHIR